MVREISAGGVVVRRAGESWQMAVIEPQTESKTEPKTEPQTESQADSASARPPRKTAKKAVLALPKGLVDPGEKSEETALREVREETGLVASLITKLADIKYVYVRSWGDQQRVFKIVSFFLFRYQSGEIDDVSREMRIEVRRALWIPLDEAPRKLSYRGERDIVRRAQQYLKSHSEV